MMDIWEMFMLMHKRFMVMRMAVLFIRHRIPVLMLMMIVMDMLVFVV